MALIKVGLEIHVYPLMESKNKLFCGCKIEINAPPNSNICEICTGQPGAHPMKPNKEAIIKSLAISKILGCTIDDKPAFQRKHYSWPDLPSGYQRTMSGAYAKPMAINGSFNGVRIMQVHLEEDPARWDPETGIIDYNRSGTPLVEIVTEPDFTTTKQVREWLESLRVHLDHADCFDERLGIKADVNISIEPGYQRVEIKNINSFTSIIEAIEYETKRQSTELSVGNTILFETRMWNGTETLPMRTKEGSSDYRFIPEQDLPRIIIDTNTLREVEERGIIDIESMLNNLLKSGMKAEDANIMIMNPVLYRHAIIMIDKGTGGEDAGIFLRRELLRVTNYHNEHPRMFKGTTNSMITLLNIYKEGKITDKIMRTIMEELYHNDFDVEKHIMDNSLSSISDEDELSRVVDDVISKNPKAAQDYRAGAIESINFLTGQIMRIMKGKADVKKTQDIIRRKLE